MIARRLGALLVAAALIYASAARAQQGDAASLDLVDPNTLRVCADPSDLPYSDSAGQGFENRIAALLGRKLGRPVAYTYFPQVIGFVRNTLGAYRCDVVIGVVADDGVLQTTTPYYRTSYALVFPTAHGLDGVTSLADPRLRDKRIGVVARTPPASVMAAYGLLARARPYPLTVDTRVEQPARTMVADIVSGAIDAGVLWGPLAGYYARQAVAGPNGAKLVVVPLQTEQGVPMSFRIAMGVRHGDQAWRRTLNRLISQNQVEIDRILVSYGVPLLDAYPAAAEP
jgi:quinoprotein dehydrogenase-associated probable ABC transporter substrate-binding protein